MNNVQNCDSYIKSLFNFNEYKTLLIPQMKAYKQNVKIR
jgi:hypothetical protein